MKADQIQTLLERLATDLVRVEVAGIVLHVRRPTFAEVLAGGEVAELIARHVVDDAGHAIAGDPLNLPGVVGAALGATVRRLYAEAANPPMPSGSSSDSLGKSG